MSDGKTVRGGRLRLPRREADYHIRLDGWLPVTDNRLRGSRDAGMRKHAEVGNWAEALRLARGGIPEATTPRTVAVTYYFKNRVKRDATNYRKVVEDALVRAGWLVDDSPEWSHFTVELTCDKGSPRTEFHIWDGLPDDDCNNRPADLVADMLYAASRLRTSVTDPSPAFVAVMAGVDRILDKLRQIVED